MADPVHGAIGAVKFEGKDVLEIDVDAPKDAKGVVVKLVELDKGLTPAEVTDDDLLGTFTLDVKKGALENEQFTPGPETGKVREGFVDVKLRGKNTLRRVAILHDAAEGDQDRGTNQVELAVEIEATVEGKKVTFSSASQAKTIARTTAGGLVVTFLMGMDKDGYFSAAQDFWTPRSDELHAAAPPSGFLTLEEVLHELDQPLPAGQGPYEEVNIVTHGTVGFIQLALDSSAKAAEMHHAFQLKQSSVGKSTLKRVDPKKTRIVLRGCRIGKDPCLLRALSQKFAGAKVFGCNFVISYTSAGGANEKEPKLERLVDHRAVFVPGALAAVAGKVDEHVKALNAQHGPFTWPVDGKKDPYRAVLDTGKDTWKGNPPQLFLGSRHDIAFPFTLDDPDPKAGDTDAGAKKLKEEAIKEAKQAMVDLRATPPKDPGLSNFKQLAYESKIFDYRPDQFEWSATNSKIIEEQPDPKDPKKTKKVVKGWSTEAIGRRSEIAARRILAISDSDPPKAEQTFAEKRARTVVPRVNDPAHFTASDHATCPIDGTTTGACFLD
jgi:hypothetical protein